ncbi:heme exporter protein CcmB [Cytobacillus firmus]|uniref:Heme exporter protein CcmB n=1 Tax=Cytobacillus firmus TaxID=1399 RepID=A0AA46PCU1_CYTFI|nr:heme exporter protein CcmB [Cytobacillus firmus]UYG98086.1 heme exporter protein CcmB [Cytobacillus firmus]
MNFYKQIVLILKRDLVLEYRQKSLLFSMVIFALMIQVFLTIAFDTDMESMRKLAAGILWIPILFSAMLGFNRVVSIDKENGVLTGLLVSSLDKGALYLGKLLGNLVLIYIVILFSVPAFFLFVKQPFPNSIGLLIAVLFLGGWGFVAMGVFLATIAQSSRITELLLPVKLFPLSVPLFLGIIQLTEIALYPSIEISQNVWLLLLVGYDVIFTIIPLFLFDYLLEV